MSSHYFQLGSEIILEDSNYVITNIVGDRWMFQLANKNSGVIRNFTRNELLAAYARGEVHFVQHGPAWRGERAAAATKTYAPPLDTHSAQARAQTTRRRTYLKRLDNASALRFDRTGRLDRAIQEIAKDIQDNRPPHRTTVHRWYKQWTARQRNLQAVTCRHDRRGASGTGRFADDVEEIIANAIDEIYLTEQRNTALETWEVIRDRVQDANLQRDPTDPLQVPGLRTIQRRIAALNKYETVSRREGERVAKRRFRAVLGTHRVGRILSRVEMDHTPLNLFVIDDKTWLPLGRPTLTVALDCRSRSLLGYHISFTGNGVDAVLACLRHAIRPKTYVQEKYPDIALPWNCYGVPAAIWVDNGSEFAGVDLHSACEELGIDLFFLPARKPEWKGRVERFLKTFNHSLIHRIPGTTFENITARGDYNPEEHAIVTMDDLEKMVHMWICDDYHNRVHRGLGARPFDVWNRDADAEPPALPSDVSRLDFHLGESVERTLWHYGIELHGGRQQYNNRDLAAVHASCGKIRVRVRYHRRDIGRVWVQDPVSEEYFEVPNIDMEYARGVSLEQHEFIVARAKVDAEGRVDHKALMAAKESLRNEIQRLLLEKKLRDRRKGARLAGMNSTAVRGEDKSVLQQYDAALRAQTALPEVARRIPDSPEENAGMEHPLRPRGQGPRRPAPRFNRRDSGSAHV